MTDNNSLYSVNAGVEIRKEIASIHHDRSGHYDALNFMGRAAGYSDQTDGNTGRQPELRFFVNGNICITIVIMLT
ncbi:MAG: hypothetical protein ACLUDU_23630 [Butyricimonas faecihominis]